MPTALDAWNATLVLPSWDRFRGWGVLAGFELAAWT